MNTQYKVEVIELDKVRKFQVVNSFGSVHSTWRTYEKAVIAARDLNRMVKVSKI